MHEVALGEIPAIKYGGRDADAAEVFETKEQLRDRADVRNVPRKDAEQGRGAYFRLKSGAMSTRRRIPVFFPLPSRASSICKASVA